MKYERTFILIKPGILERKLIGEIIQRFEKKGMDILALKMCKPSKSQYATHYKEHYGKSFYDMLIRYMTSGHVIAMVLGGVGAIGVCRTLVGSTDPQQALPGSIRGDYGIENPYNVIHASDSAQSATREIKIFFSSSEIRKA